MEKIIQSKKSVVVAADVPNMKSLSALAEAMVGVQGIGAFKIGLVLGLQNLSEAVKTVRGFLGSDFPLIFDLQKAGNDIPDMGPQFAQVVKDSGVSAAILFPFAGPATQEAWTKLVLTQGSRCSLVVS